MAATQSHLVKIGPYILISIMVGAIPSAECTISDTLGTEVQEPFVEYYTYYVYMENGETHYYMDDHTHGYGYMAESRESILDGDPLQEALTDFPKRYYLLVEYASLPDNYELHVKTHFDEYSLTKADICELIGE